jgi:hypothetical protein
MEMALSTYVYDVIFFLRNRMEITIKQEPTLCEHQKIYYCLKTGGARCRKCKSLLEIDPTPRVNPNTTMTDQEILQIDFYDLYGIAALWVSNEEKIKHYRTITNTTPSAGETKHSLGRA